MESQEDLFDDAGGGNTCRVCGRPLSDPESVAAGIGPVCGGKHGGRSAGATARNERPYHRHVSGPDDGFLLDRGEDGTVETNVPHTITYHSPDGYEFGYGGSGPADLALNIVECLLRRMKHSGPRQMKGKASEGFAASYLLYQDFKRDFIAPAKPGTVIKYDVAEHWIKKRLPALSDALGMLIHDDRAPAERRTASSGRA